jgi:2-polyprenyl-3-methyl-5-hydroxy-6-metoxy-1,4-benzoquinol methylase
MNRNEKILKHINKNGIGIEVGPSHRPVAPKRDGYNVHIIDHASKEQLKEKYKLHGVDIDSIEEVDFIWSGETYKQLVGDNVYDFIIASHVIEHTPDFIGFINNCGEILKDDGVLSLVVPDKRYCFDRFRPLTGLSRIIDAHNSKLNVHSAGSVAEYFLNVVSNGNEIGWHRGSPESYRFIHSVEDARNGMLSALNNQYLDVHAWCFTPSSFRLIINDIFNLGLIHFSEIEFNHTCGLEFYVTLSKRKRDGYAIPSRMDLLEMINNELVDDYLKLPHDFDGSKYLEINHDVKKAGVDAVTHYLTYGIKEGRSY